MRVDIVPGAIFPDYELSDQTGKRRKLSELQGHDPMILVLGRGGFCPKDRRQADGLTQLHRELEVGYCRLVTITTDNILETNEYRTGVGAHLPFLSDSRGGLAPETVGVGSPVVLGNRPFGERRSRLGASSRLRH